MALRVGPKSVLRPLAALSGSLLQDFATRQARPLVSIFSHRPRSRTPQYQLATKRQCTAPLHTSSARLAKRARAHNDEEIPDGPPTTDFSRMDMLGQTPAPSTSVDICSSDGFKLNSGVSVYDGNGVMLVGGEAFVWRPWGPDMKLVNAQGQWEVSEEAFAVLDLLWPRPGMFYTTTHVYNKARYGEHHGLTWASHSQT
jgi:NADH dehydrogenase [ubiquinone] 1 alpha subcomplex assembly factor 3